MSAPEFKGLSARPPGPGGPDKKKTETTGTALVKGARALLPAAKFPTLPPLLPRSNYADFLPEIEAVAEREHSPLAKVLLITLSVLFAILLAWAAIGEVDKVATATAQVRPFGRVKIINHLEGGIVRTLNVREGSAVKEGDILVELDPTLVEQELAKADNDYLTRSAETIRLTAEVGGEKLEFPKEIVEARPDLVTSQMRLYMERQSGLSSKRGSADDIVRQKQSEANGLVAQLESAKEGLKIIVEQERATATLSDKGYFPKLRYLSIKRQVSDTEGQIAQLAAQLASTRSQLQDALNKRASLDRDAAAESLDKLMVARRERDIAYRTREQQRARLENTILRAPVEGIVQKLAIAAPGQSVRGGDPIMNVVPVGDSLVVEAQVGNQDIGYIRVGQTATVRVLTYDHIKYGTLEGVVEQISADAVEDQKTREFTFPVVVRTSKTYLGDKPGLYPVAPGMAAEVDFKLGRRTVLSYLTDRMEETASNAFKER
jgi:adhesin transport system membrane fusion protein